MFQLGTLAAYIKLIYWSHECIILCNYYYNHISLNIINKFVVANKCEMK